MENLLFFLCFTGLIVLTLWMDKKLLYRCPAPPASLLNIPEAEYVSEKELKEQILLSKNSAEIYDTPHLVITPDGVLLGCRVADDLVICPPEEKMLIVSDCLEEIHKQEKKMLALSDYNRLFMQRKKISDCFRTAGYRINGRYWFDANVSGITRDEYADINWFSGEGKVLRVNILYDQNRHRKSGMLCKY